ncbi:gliding motility-associated C-terminal domain-containing protein [Hymenobacter sp. BT175]|uniref:T9SS type B sorting domain-containing protein n=1 Tax=Hymenobacter translucens TaxID=2886507 RepID=UPI001D0EDA48|nr:gliding motility-associated C-terminal domain-containing protein [Hymenobacter translucens]MCC2545231.1 gliding motility-associated C-terminal domain-containing protein [Hymenobacter translucens]
MLKRLLFAFAALCLWGNTPVYAQLENRNWYFGNNAGITFTSGLPTALLNSAMVTYEATATVSDAAGNLLFYTNAVNIWNRNHQPMVNGQAIGGHESAAQGAVIVKNPANPDQYYIVVVDGCDNRLVGGVKYNLVDMTQAGGQGAVAQRAVQLSTIQVTERVLAVPHANGRDTWIVVHGWNSNVFYAFLLSPTGISATPVATSIGTVHAGGGGAFANANAVGYMKVSPAGNKLAIAMRDNIFELFDFNNNTGQLSNHVPLRQFYRSYGVEFSPDGSRLYGTTLDGNTIYQFNLLAGSPAAIAASAVVIGNSGGAFAGALELGPDQRIYLAKFNSGFLGSIDNPNALGTACGFRSDAVFPGGRVGQLGLPNFPKRAVATASFTATGACVGSAASFSGLVAPSAPGATYSWNFGDPGSGAANTGSGANTTHVYSTAGFYTVTLVVTLPGVSVPLTTTQMVVVTALPVVTLGPPTRQLCQGSQLSLSVGSLPPGATAQWQDGATGTSYTVRTAGTYTVTVTTASGCTAQASVTVEMLPAPVVNLGPTTRQLCPGSQITLAAGPQPVGTTYQWQDGSTGSSFLVVQAGTYSVTLTSAAGCTAQATVVVQNNPLPVVNLGPPNQQVCQGTSLSLTPGPQPTGTTYRWQDGSTASTFAVQQTGTYAVTVTSPQGCTNQGFTTVSVIPVPVVQLGRDTLACLEQAVLLRANAQPAGTTYRWQDGSTASTFSATSAGTYSLIVTSPAGCTAQDELIVRDAGCPFTIPNIITPNGDQKNDVFVLKGLNAPQWQVTIFNRWGTQVYQNSSYDNSWAAAGQPGGLYYYMLRANDGRQFRGWVEVVR